MSILIPHGRERRGQRTYTYENSISSTKQTERQRFSQNMVPTLNELCTNYFIIVVIDSSFVTYSTRFFGRQSRSVCNSLHQKYWWVNKGKVSSELVLVCRSLLSPKIRCRQTETSGAGSRDTISIILKIFLQEYLVSTFCLLKVHQTTPVHPYSYSLSSALFTVHLPQFPNIDIWMALGRSSFST